MRWPPADAIIAIDVRKNTCQRVWAFVVCALCGFGIGVLCGLYAIRKGR